MGELVREMVLKLLVVALVGLQCVSAAKHTVQVEGAIDNPTTLSDDGGLLCNGRFRAVELAGGRYRYLNEQGCEIQWTAASSLAGGGAAWVITNVEEARFHVASSATDPPANGWTPWTGFAAGVLTLRLVGDSCDQCESHHECLVACSTNHAQCHKMQGHLCAGDIYQNLAHGVSTNTAFNAVPVLPPTP